MLPFYDMHRGSKWYCYLSSHSWYLSMHCTTRSCNLDGNCEGMLVSVQDALYRTHAPVELLHLKASASFTRHTYLHPSASPSMQEHMPKHCNRCEICNSHYCLANITASQKWNTYMRPYVRKHISHTRVTSGTGYTNKFKMGLSRSRFVSLLANMLPMLPCEKCKV